MDTEWILGERGGIWRTISLKCVRVCVHLYNRNMVFSKISDIFIFSEPLFPEDPWKTSESRGTDCKDNDNFYILHRTYFWIWTDSFT